MLHIEIRLWLRSKTMFWWILWVTQGFPIEYCTIAITVIHLSSHVKIEYYLCCQLNGTGTQYSRWPIDHPNILSVWTFSRFMKHYLTYFFYDICYSKHNKRLMPMLNKKTCILKAIISTLTMRVIHPPPKSCQDIWFGTWKCLMLTAL